MKNEKTSTKGFLVTMALILGAVLGTAGVSCAIINGQSDGDRHPHVGAVDNGEDFCSGSAISLYLFVTGAHCFAYPGEQVWVTFDPEPFVLGKREARYFSGTWYPHPEYCIECGPGLGFGTNDVAVFDGSVFPA